MSGLVNFLYGAWELRSIDAEAVRLRVRIHPSRGRALAPEMAWAVLWVMDGRNPTWSDPVHRNDKIKNLTSALRLLARTGHLRALPVALEQIRFEEGVVLSGVEALGREQLLTGGVMEFYSVV